LTPDLESLYLPYRMTDVTVSIRRANASPTQLWVESSEV
jgi:hypothetical protein